MGAGASTTVPQSDSEKAAAYDQIMAKVPELIAAKAIDEAKVKQILLTVTEQPTSTKPAAAKPTPSPETEAEISLEEVFQNFCAIYRETLMTNTAFAKFCGCPTEFVLPTHGFFHSGVDSKLVDKKFPKPQIDMVWSKAAGKEKKVGYDIFLRLLDGVANAKGTPVEELHAHIKSHATVKNSGTKGQSRFYDDKKTWTGVANRGGPTTLDPKSSLSQLADRDNKADVRGVIQK